MDAVLSYLLTGLSVGRSVAIAWAPVSVASQSCDEVPTVRIASPEMFPEAEMLPHLICSRPIFIGGANDEADQHGGA